MVQMTRVGEMSFVVDQRTKGLKRFLCSLVVLTFFSRRDCKVGQIGRRSLDFVFRIGSFDC